MKMYLYSLREYDELKYCEKYRDEKGIDFDYSTEYPTLENLGAVKGCDAVSMTPCQVSKEMIQKMYEQGVKYILCRSIGYDHVDLGAAKACGMKVANVSYPANGVANYAILMMMMCLRNMPHIMKRVELQDYTLKGKIGRDLSNCTVGVIGTGNIGATVIKHLSAFGCKVLAYDVMPNESISQYATYVDFETLIGECDVISLHTNATNENYHMINAQTLKLMKGDVVIINTARGKLIDTSALIEALEAKKVGAVALDVLENEDGLYYHNRMGEVIANRELAILRTFPNVIMSPHVAFYTDEDVESMVRGCFESLEAFERNQKTVHEVEL